MRYQELLLDPRWQRRRLEILDRDNFRCKLCGSGERTLHIHHKYYEKNKLPWEYPEDCFQTLCKLCHGLVEYHKEYGWALDGVTFPDASTVLVEGRNSSGVPAMNLLVLFIMVS